MTNEQEVSVETQIAASSNELPEESTEDVMTSEEASFLLYEQGRYSPILLSPSEVPSDQVVTHAQACTGLIMAQSRVMRGEQADDKFCSSESDQNMLSQAEKNGFVEGEDFTTEVRIEQQYLWMDKYRPRKPRYFNRVHTGFEWNKYSVAGGVQVYSVTNYSTCCFLLHLQLSKNLFKGTEFDSTFQYSVP